MDILHSIFCGSLLELRRKTDRSFVRRFFLVTRAAFFAADIADIGLSKGLVRLASVSGNGLAGYLGNPERHCGDEGCNKDQIPHGNPPTGKWFSLMIFSGIEARGDPLVEPFAPGPVWDLLQGVA
jgi:hypothetical protein